MWPEQLRFGALEAVRTYVDDVVAHLKVPPVHVRHRRGGTRAHYSQGEIAIPTTHGWAMRESVVLHEVAHHACFTDRSSGAHDRYFTARMLELADLRLGPGCSTLAPHGLIRPRVFRWRRRCEQRDRAHQRAADQGRAGPTTRMKRMRT